MFLPNDHVYVYATNVHGFEEIQEYDMKTRSKVRTVYAVDDANVGGAIVSRDGQTLVGVRVGPRAVHWFDPQLAELQRNLDKSVPNADVSVVSESADQSKLLIEVSAADMPGSIYYMDRNEGAMHRIG